MTALLEHRGPDDGGIYVGGRVALGHRRLAILDPEGGAQPMFSGSRRSVLIHNGEVYNSPELSFQLQKTGFSPMGHSDTEVIVEGMERYGEDYVDRLNGIFAFAWHDIWGGSTVLARDPFGVKPLYYHVSSKRVLFASEIRALLADPELKRELDPDELRVLLTLRYSPAPGTLFKGVRKLSPGHFLRISGSDVREVLYDTWTPQTDCAASFEESVHAYRDELGRAVRRQMLSDVPVGAFLSGGLDSGAVVKLMANGDNSVPTFTVGFDETGAADFAGDERGHAQQTAKALGVSNTPVTCDADTFAESLSEVVRAMEEPVGSASALPYWVLAREAARSLKVVLTGQGADEPHGGYSRYQGVILSQRFGRFVPPGTGAVLSAAVKGRRDRLRRGLSILGERDPLDLMLNTYRHFSDDECDALIRSSVAGRPDLARKRIERWRSRVDHLDPLAQMMFVDSRVWLADDLLLYGDKLSMAHGLEVRVPFLDRELMRRVESLPVEYRVSYGQPKKLHKAAVSSFLPEAIVNLPKLGFETPVDRWFRTRWVPRMPEWLWGPDSFLPSVLQPETMQRMVDDHREGRRDHSVRLYTLLTLEFWGRAFL